MAEPPFPSSLPADHFFYFAYGANMDAAVLAERGVTPRGSWRGFLERHRLAFTYLGYDGVEPRFANIEPHPEDRDDTTPVHGVCHLLNGSSLAALDVIEGNGTAYQRELCTFQTYSGEDVQAWVYVALPGLRVPPAPPSKRYLRILVRGAKANGLDAAYVEYLASCTAVEWTAYDDLPPPPEPLSIVTEAQLAAHGPTSHTMWVSLAGRVFDVTGTDRGFMRKQAGKEALPFFLRMLCVGDGDGSEAEAPFPTRLADCSERQASYIRAWAWALHRMFPIVSLLQ